MDGLLTSRRRSGFAAIEVAAVLGVLGLLLAMGFMLYRSMRVAARVSVAESNLGQISTGLELYFLKYNAYPPQGSNLAEVLAPFVEDPKVFENPLKEETTPGETISDLYQEPTLSEIDRPNEYITAMVSDNGTTAVILKTGKKVERLDDLVFDPTAPPGDIMAALDPPDDTPGDAGQGSVLPPGDGQDEPGINAAPNDFTAETPPGVITAKDCFDAQFAAVASDLTWGEGGPPVGITASLKCRSQEPNPQESGAYVADLFGGDPASAGDTETHVVRNQDSFTLEATASYGDWHATYSSEADTDQVLTLRNGDLPPEFDPYKQPIAVGSAISGMVDPATGTVTIGDNQVLYLFEFGTRDRAQKAFDFQDFVLLVTLTAPADASQCEDPPEPQDPPPAPDPEPDPEPEPDEGFDVADGGETVTKMCSDVRIKAIGSQFGYADGTMVDIVAQANMGEGWLDLYGGQPINGGEEFSQASVPAGTAIVIKGEISGSYERWLWTRYGYPLGYTSTDGSGQVLTLRRGDTPVRFQPGFPNQAAVGDLLAPHVDPQTGVVSIADNEVLYLWDFNPLRTNYGIDYQDLIILATAVAAERECEGEEEEPGSEPAADPARPVLALAPAGLETSETTFTIQVSNNATEAKDEAKNVQLNAQVVQGEQYVDTIACTSSLGKIESGQTRNVPVTVQTRASWATAYGQQIQIRVSVLNEDNWPEGNENKSVTVTINGPEAPHPLLAVIPWGTHGANDAAGDAEAGGSGYTTARQYAFKVANTASQGNPAANVRVAFSVIEGDYYVNQIAYDGDLGTIGAGDCKYCSVRFFPKDSRWNNAVAGTQVRLRVSVVQETNDPNASIGKLAHVIIVKGSTITGSINLNPNNNSDFEFLLLTKPGGATITRDDLHDSNGVVAYEGLATQVRVRPKGNGNQNGLTVDGSIYPLRNGRVYTITPSGSMAVRVYNSKHGNGKSMGKWWIEISAPAAAIESD